MNCPAECTEPFIEFVQELLRKLPFYLECVYNPGSGPDMIGFERGEEIQNTISFRLLGHERAPDEYRVA